MALPGFVYVLIAFLKPALMMIGALAVFGAIFVKSAPKLPDVVTSAVRRRLLRMGMGMGSGLEMLVQDSDGVLSLASAEYDADNGGYWAKLGDNWEFFSSEGKGGGPKWFYGANVVLAYDGLGAVSDLVSAEIGRQAKVKKRVSNEPGKLASAYEEIVTRARERIDGFDGPDPLADGGVNKHVTEWTSYLPERKVVDLRDTLHNAPFHVRPAQFHRVEENAKAGQSVGFSENLIRFGLLITGFMLAVIAFVIMGNGGGGAASGMSLPF